MGTHVNNRWPREGMVNLHCGMDWLRKALLREVSVGL